LACSPSGFAARPLGGIFFAHAGDRIGRKPIMVSTLVLMGASTTAIGLTPPYEQIGIAGAAHPRHAALPPGILARR
jgi:MFS family permease